MWLKPSVEAVAFVHVAVAAETVLLNIKVQNGRRRYSDQAPRSNTQHTAHSKFMRTLEFSKPAASRVAPESVSGAGGKPAISANAPVVSDTLSIAHVRTRQTHTQHRHAHTQRASTGSAMASPPPPTFQLVQVNRRLCGSC